MNKTTFFKALIVTFLLFQFSASYALFGIHLKKKAEVDTTQVNESLLYEGKYSPTPAIDSLLIFAYSHLNKPYRSGSKGPNSFDCSGFTGYVFAHAGHPLQACSSAQVVNGIPVEKSALLPGDLVFFNGRSARSSRIGHVGIVLSTEQDNTFSFIHASTSSGVIVSKNTEPYYAKRYVTARRVISPNGNLATQENLHPVSVYSSSVVQDTSIPKSYGAEYKPKMKKVKVKRGESLYLIAKKYNCTVRQLKQWNNLKSTNLKSGQVLYVYLENTAVPTAINNQNISNNDADYDLTEHMVEKGETLFEISRKYNCKVDEIVQRNNLSNTSIRPNQKLLIRVPKEEVISEEHEVAAGESLYSISKRYGISISDIMDKNDLPSEKIHPGQKLRLK